MIETEQLMHLFVEVADTLVADFDLIEFLHALADDAATISGSACVGIVLADESGRLHFVAASTTSAQHLELAQLQSADGPCLDCYRTRTPVVVTDMAAVARRWPGFTERARQLGMQQLHAFPMRLRERTLGALNVFGGAGSTLAADEARIIQALADVATIAILQERAIAAAETLTQQLQAAFDSRLVIEQAKGVVALSKGVGVNDAFALLRSHARKNRVRLSDLAQSVVTGALDAATIAGDPARTQGLAVRGPRATGHAHP